MTYPASPFGGTTKGGGGTPTPGGGGSSLVVEGPGVLLGKWTYTTSPVATGQFRYTAGEFYIHSTDTEGNDQSSNVNSITTVGGTRIAVYDAADRAEIWSGELVDQRLAQGQVQIYDYEGGRHEGDLVNGTAYDIFRQSGDSTITRLDGLGAIDITAAPDKGTTGAVAEISLKTDKSLAVSIKDQSVGIANKGVTASMLADGVTLTVNDGTITPTKLDADTDAKRAAFRSAIQSGIRDVISYNFGASGTYYPLSAWHGKIVSVDWNQGANIILEGRATDAFDGFECTIMRGAGNGNTGSFNFEGHLLARQNDSINIIRHGTDWDGVPYIASINPPGGTPPPDASTTQKGIIEIATAAESKTGTSNTLAVPPSGVRSVVGAQVSAAEKNAGTVTAIRRYSPKDVHDMIDAHSPAATAVRHTSTEIFNTPTAAGSKSSRVTITLDYKQGSSGPRWTWEDFEEYFVVTNPTNAASGGVSNGQDPDARNVFTFPRSKFAANGDAVGTEGYGCFTMTRDGQVAATIYDNNTSWGGAHRLISISGITATGVVASAASVLHGHVQFDGDQTPAIGSGSAWSAFGAGTQPSIASGEILKLGLVTGRRSILEYYDVDLNAELIRLVQPSVVNQVVVANQRITVPLSKFGLGAGNLYVGRNASNLLHVAVSAGTAQYTLGWAVLSSGTPLAQEAITQTAYDALAVKNSSTLYFIVG